MIYIAKTSGAIGVVFVPNVFFTSTLRERDHGFFVTREFSKRGSDTIIFSVFIFPLSAFIELATHFRRSHRTPGTCIGRHVALPFPSPRIHIVSCRRSRNTRDNSRLPAPRRPRSNGTAGTALFFSFPATVRA